MCQYDFDGSAFTINGKAPAKSEESSTPPPAMEREISITRISFVYYIGGYAGSRL